MLAKELISEVLPAVKTSDTGAQVLSWMEFFRVSHLPIVNNEDFLGLISDTDIYTLDDLGEPIGAHTLSLFSPFVEDNQHIFEVVELVARLKLTVIPVIAGKTRYLGSISQSNLVQQFAHLTGTDQPGALIVLTMSVRDYSLSEISRIVEENNVKILSLYVYSPEDSMKLDVTIKTSTQDISSVLRSLDRYGYEIKASFMEDAELDTMYRNRYEEFMRYLNT